MSAVPGPALAVTPSKRNAEIEAVIRKLNDDYSLGIVVPDPGLTPSRRRELGAQDERYARCDRIFRAIQFLHYQRDDRLAEALTSFFIEAKAASLRWVPKPRADPGTLPSPTDYPRAQTPAQQRNLQIILADILDSLKTRRRPAAPPLALPRPGGAPNLGSPAAPGDDNPGSPLPNSPASAGSKRSCSSDSDPGSKRLRNGDQAASPSRQPGPSSTLADALDRVPTRRRPGPVAVAVVPDRRRLHHELDRSSSTSDSSESSKLSSIFSEFERQQSTQSTVGPEPRDPKPTIVVPRTVRVVDRPAPLRRPAGPGPPRPPAVATAAYADMNGVSDLVSDEIPGRPAAGRGQVLQADGSPTAIQRRLQNIWPKFPRWLRDAPLALAWELTRICLHCKVDLEDDSLRYDPQWATSDMASIWRSLRELDVFRGKSFPERPAAEAFAAALSDFESRGNTVVMSAALEFNSKQDGPLFLLDMKPLRFDEGCRLTRRFGPDRFLEVLVPSPTAINAPAIVKDGGSEHVIRWLTEKPHSLVGRQWQAFYTKDAGYRKPAKELRLGPDAKPTFKERVHFFAEDGHDFRRAAIRTRDDIPASDSVQRRTALGVALMLDWLLQLERNEAQPHLKLFSRIQLGLSKTFPTVVFEPDQIHHQPEDILSPIGKVMNDGIGRMSRSVARKIRDMLGLSDIPSAIQGRMGSAKGMWLMDVADTGDADWIETYPSQRKWECNWADPWHRTLEVRSVASELKPAALNLQFLPVLEDRARDKTRMRGAIAERLRRDLQKQFEDQKAALKCPLQFRQWVHENSNNRAERVRHGRVPFLGGLPENRGEILGFLLNSGFDPKKQKYLQELAWDLQKQKCEILRTKLNIRVGRSAYIYMVVDFWGVLEENEVHVGFSSKFRDESDDVSYTLLADCDVLVARSPAHFVSDVQKVRAVFKPELHALKDVIVFPAKGDVPLADKLSGGDYDGDIAWVCWDPDIVENFVNADVPAEPDLSAYLSKDKTTFEELVCRTAHTGQRARHQAVYDMIGKSFQFAMQPNFLGICTNYKERLCYHNNSVSNPAAVLLSSLVGKLVDQSKQGIVFDAASWDRLRREKFSGRMALDDPAYKGDVWAGKGEPRHVIDYLKFFVAKPAIDREMESFDKAMQSQAGAEGAAAHYWDPDLAVYYKHFRALAEGSRSLRAVLDALTNAIGAVREEWTVLMSNRHSALTYPEKVKRAYASWCSIEPRAVGRAGSNRLDPKTAALLEQPFLAERGAGATSYWALLRASAAFQAYYKSPKFVWQMAGAQLAFIKAQLTSGSAGAGEHAPLLVTPLMYAGMVPDGRFVKQYVARLEGDGSEYPDLHEDEVGDGEEAGFGRGDDVD